MGKALQTTEGPTRQAETWAVPEAQASEISITRNLGGLIKCVSAGFYFSTFNFLAGGFPSSYYLQPPSSLSKMES